METADQNEVGVREALEEVHVACRDLARLKGIDEIAEAALGMALSLTRSSVAFMGLSDETGSYEQVFSRSADASRTATPGEAEKLILGGVSSSNPSVCARLLEAGGETVGMLGVARELNYTQLHRQALGILANQVAATIQIARLRGRRQEMVDTLVNLRSDLERTEKERLVNAERAESAVRLEKAHELAVEALLAVSLHARSGHDLSTFYRRLGESVAGLVGASKVLFWQLNGGTLSAVPGGYGLDDSSISSLRSVPCGPDRDDLQSRVVYKDFIYLAAEGDRAPETDDVRIGCLAAYQCEVLVGQAQ